MMEPMKVRAKYFLDAWETQGRRQGRRADRRAHDGGGFTHRVAHVGEREPQREDDGQQQQVRGLLASGFGPL